MITFRKMHDQMSEVYYAVLNLIDQVSSGALDLNLDSQDDIEECRQAMIHLLHSLWIALPALLFTYDARLGCFSRLAKIQTNCTFFFSVENWRFFVEMRLRLWDTELRDHDRSLTKSGKGGKFKHARALSVCWQGNLSKAFKTIVQKGLATEDKIQVLRDKHPSSPTILLQDQDILQDIRY